MIGQEKLIKDIDNLIANKHFPKFSIIVGAKGSGRKELCKYIAEALNVFWCFEPDCKVETVRNAIWDASKVYNPTMYAFADADAMSVQAKNSLLKVTEEPPKNAYFIMTLEDINSTLPTIRSRAVIFNMDAYTGQELVEYSKTLATRLDSNIVTELCSTPGEVNYLADTGIENFYGFVNKVFENIATVSGSNAFKIGSSIALKDTDTGYDLKMFLKAFKQICWNNFKQTKEARLLKAIQLTNVALQKANYKSVNKQMIFDTWLLAIREEWM